MEKSIIGVLITNLMASGMVFTAGTNQKYAPGTKIKEQLRATAATATRTRRVLYRQQS